jgi:hypothetical protein
LELKEQGAPTVDIDADEADFSSSYLQAASQTLLAQSDEVRQKVVNYFTSSSLKSADNSIKGVLRSLEVNCRDLDRPIRAW